MHRVLVTLFLIAMTSTLTVTVASQTQPSSEISLVQSLIAQRHFDKAIENLEQSLARDPANAEAKTYLATARVYRGRDYVKGMDTYADAFRAGGGASFLVFHSHEVTKMSTDELTDYCRGWLHLRKGSVSFTSQDSDHGFKLTKAEISEFKENRQKRLFHIKTADKNFNFSPRSHDEQEVLLIVVVYQKFVGQPDSAVR